MIFRLTLPVLLACLQFSPARSVAEEEGGAPPSLDPRLLRFDSNGNGRLEKAEIPPAVARVFARQEIDHDGDGIITAGEAARLRIPSAANRPKGKGRVSPDVKPNRAAIRPHGEEAQAAGLNPDTLADLDATLQGHVDAGQVAGVVGLVHRDGHRGYLEAFGRQDIEAGIPMPEDAIFRLKSMSKPVVTIAALILYDEGRFTLDEPVAKHLPEWSEPVVLRKNGETEPAKRPITPRMLMTHSSGLYYHLPGDPPFSGMPPRTETTTLAAYSKALAAQPLVFHPGEDYRYGTSIDVLGRYVEAVSGVSLDAFLAERVFTPLGMKDTGFWVPEAKQDRLAQLYARSAQGSLVPARERFPPTRKPSLFMGGAGLCGTAGDYERFCRMLLGGGELDGVRLLKSETVDLVFENHLTGIGKSYGLGGAVDGKGGYAWGGANGTKFWIDRDNRMTAVFMVQTQRYKATTYDDYRRLVLAAAGIADPARGVSGGGFPTR